MISNTNMLPNKATSLLIIDELLFASVGLGVIGVKPMDVHLKLGRVILLVQMKTVTTNRVD